MADIMMCKAVNCPYDKKCTRHKKSGTIPHPTYQSYWLREDDAPVGDDCDNFWPKDQPQ